MSKKVTIAGVPVEIVSDAEAETVDFVVCVPDGPSNFPDNLKGFCCKCGRKIMYRWHAPLAPPKICIHCAAELAKKAMDKSTS